jgi:hypothetical protein
MHLETVNTQTHSNFPCVFILFYFYLRTEYKRASFTTSQPKKSYFTIFSYPNRKCLSQFHSSTFVYATRAAIMKVMYLCICSKHLTHKLTFYTRRHNSDVVQGIRKFFPIHIYRVNLKCMKAYSS